MFRQKRITGIITLSILLAISLAMSAGCSVRNKMTSAQTSDAKALETTTAAVSETEGTTQEKTLEEKLAFLDDSDFHGTVLIAKDGEIVFEKSYKYSNVESQELNTNDTRYEIGSITKQFTTVGLMMLVEDGRVNLDDTLDKYIPEYSHAGEVTIRQLLNMTSGIVDYLNEVVRMDSKGLTMEQIFADQELTESFFKPLDQKFDFTTVLSLVDTYDLKFEPGSRVAYSSTGYCFISEVIARVSGMSFEDYMMQNVLSPAGLETASFEPDQNTATGYLAPRADQLIEMPDADITGEGGLLMTAHDLYTWSQVIVNQELLSEESWNEIMEAEKSGHGFRIQAYYPMIDGGGTYGFSSMEHVCKQPNVVIIVLTNNSSQSNSMTMKRIINNALYHYDLPLMN